MGDSLYLGKVFDPATKALGEKFELDPADLTTHGIVIGMTGSGKTGLSIGLIEELLKARVPVIVVDPKGDMGNLALAFDRLAPEQFEPWIDRDAATREGKPLADIAAETAAAWTKGLGQWDLSQPDVAAYAAGRRCRVFTPGASAGIPINMIDSLDAPAGDFEANEEELRDEIDALVMALLGFVGIQADPSSSREYILLASLIENAWRQHQNLSLESLIGQVANPPITKVGVLPIDTFYPANDRNKLMLALNNLVASPRFEVWRQGEPIDIERWVRGEGGLPQLSIFYTAHLDDEQRMFATALLLNKLKTWARKQPGTSDLRCLFYMDEIFGYFPPTANPPTKKPLLTLLKQARAYGVGILLATQNPVDLDYKGLANMGFWAVGRLQTRQDQDRVKQGIESALADSGLGVSFDDLIAGVEKRVFLIHDIHRKAPELVNSRWAMSYLRGPITRDEIPQLGQISGVEVQETASAASPAVAAAAPASGQAAVPQTQPQAAAPVSAAPPLPGGLQARYLNRHGGNVASAMLFVKAGVRYRAGGSVSDEEVRQIGFAIEPNCTATEVVESEPAPVDETSLQPTVPPGLNYSDLPAWLMSDGLKPLERVLRDRLDDRFETQILFDPNTKTLARPGEDTSAFAMRLQSTPQASKQRDALEQKLAKKRSDLQIKAQEASGRKKEKWLSVGTSVLSNLGIIFGKKRTVTGVGSVLTKNRMENTSEQRVAQLTAEVAELEQELAGMQRVDPSRFEQRLIKPAKTDVSLIRYDFVWVY
jgi:hypothetical protein